MIYLRCKDIVKAKLAREYVHHDPDGRFFVLYSLIFLSTIRAMTLEWKSVEHV